MYTYIKLTLTGKTPTNELINRIKYRILEIQIKVLTVVLNIFKNQTSKNKPNLPKYQLKYQGKLVNITSYS